MKDLYPLHDKWGGIFFCKVSSFQDPIGVRF